MSCRIDKFVWAVRIAKTRSQAAELISKGKIKLNGTTVKPARDIKQGDEINVSRHSSVFTYKIVDVLDKRVGPKLVENYLIDLTPEEEKEKLRLYQVSQRIYRDSGSGKPTKKDRRDLEDYMENWD